jgi:hypothetical protein
LFAVLIFDRLEPIGNLVWDILLRDCRRVTDDLFSSGFVVIGPLFMDEEHLWPRILEDTAGPGSS